MCCSIRTVRQLAAVRQDGTALAVAVGDHFDEVTLQYVAFRHASDREIVLAAVAQNGDALEYASEALRADREVRGAASSHASSHFASSRAPHPTSLHIPPLSSQVVLAAVSTRGSALQYASEALQVPQ